MTALRDPILTDRLTLRMSRGDDAAWIAKEIAQEDVHKWLTAPSRPYTLADATEFLASIQDDPNHRVIEYLDQPIGMIGYSVHDDGAKVLGYWLAQSMSGQGLMSEAAKAMVLLSASACVIKLFANANCKPEPLRDGLYCVSIIAQKAKVPHSK